MRWAAVSSVTSAETVSLFRHDFIDSDAGDIRIAPCYLLSIIEAVRAHNRETGDRFKPQRQILGSTFRDFPATTEVAAHVDDAVLYRPEPLAPGCHDFRRRFLESVVQQNIFLHGALLVDFLLRCFGLITSAYYVS